MTTPTNIRFTAEESAAIDAYAQQKGLRRTSAVRELVRIGLQNAAASGLNTAAALEAVAAELRELRAGQLGISVRLEGALPKKARQRPDVGGDA